MAMADSAVEFTERPGGKSLEGFLTHREFVFNVKLLLWFTVTKET